MTQDIPFGASDLRRNLEYDAAITQLYYRYAASIFRNYDRWKDIDEYYFIELELDMVYVSLGNIGPSCDSSLPFRDYCPQFDCISSPAFKLLQ